MRGHRVRERQPRERLALRRAVVHQALGAFAGEDTVVEQIGFVDVVNGNPSFRFPIVFNRLMTVLSVHPFTSVFR